MKLFHDNMDRLSLQVEKNVLYDVGGEVQRILEDHNINRLSSQNVDHSLYNEIDKMLRIIIDRVKEIEDGGYTSIFDSTEDNFITTTLSHINSKSKANGKLIFESNILNNLEESDEISNDNLSSFTMNKNTSKNKIKNKELPSAIDFKENRPRLKQLRTPTSNSKITSSLSQQSLSLCIAQKPRQSQIKQTVKAPQRITKGYRKYKENEQTIKLNISK